MSAFIATVDLTLGIVEAMDKEEDLMESKFKKMDEHDDIHIAYVKCGSGRSTIRPKLYLGPGPMPRRYFAEDE